MQYFFFHNVELLSYLATFLFVRFHVSLEQCVLYKTRRRCTAGGDGIDYRPVADFLGASVRRPFCPRGSAERLGQALNQ